MDLALEQWLAAQLPQQVDFRQNPPNPLQPLGPNWARGTSVPSFGAKPRESVIQEAGEGAGMAAGK